MIAVAMSVACSSALVGTTYHGDGYAFRFATPPESWKRIHVSHASLA